MKPDHYVCIMINLWNIDPNIDLLRENQET